MKQIVVFNGSPRMDGNTVTVLDVIAKGARDNAAEVKYYTLFKMKFMACQSCFACRMKEDCVINDELHEALQKVKAADAVVIGSPIYMMQMTGPVKNLYDRLFPLMDTEGKPRFGTKKLVTVWSQSVDDLQHLRLVLRVHRGDVPLVRLRLGGQHRLRQRQRPGERGSRRRAQGPRLRGREGPRAHGVTARAA